MEFGSKLKRAREAHSLNQEDIAEQIGVSRQTISNWENNRSLPDLRSIVMISDIYQISLDELLKGDGVLMQKLINDSEVKKANDKLSLLTVLVLTLSTLSILLFSWDSFPQPLVFVLVTLDLLFLAYFIKIVIKTSEINFEYKLQEDGLPKEKYNSKKLLFFLIVLVIIGITGGILAGYFLN